MAHEKLTTARALTLLQVRITGAVSLLTVALVSVYLFALLDFSPEQWTGFAEIVGVLFVFLFGAVFVVNRHFLGPLTRFLLVEERELGASSEAELRQAYQSLCALPRWMYVSGNLWWILGGALVAVGMSLRFEGLSTFSLGVIVFAAASGGLVTTTFLYFWAKQSHSELQNALGERLGGPEVRGELSTRVSLRTKLVVSATTVNAVSVVFAILLVVVRASDQLESNSIRVQERFLEHRIEALLTGESDRFESLVEEARQLSVASGLIVVDATTGDVELGPPNLLGPGDRLAILEHRERGNSGQLTSSNVLAWQQIPGTSRIVVSHQSWDDLRGDWGRTWLIFGFVALGAGLVAYALSRVLARDVWLTANELGQSADRIAQGDLRLVRVADSEDELGWLARSFEMMISAVRSLFSGITAAANRVDESAAEVDALSNELKVQAGNQSDGVVRAAESMEVVRREVSGISESARELNQLVEESSSAILEMGASGEELSDTASVLSGKASEAASSVSQLAESVSAVGRHTTELADMAMETSTSMEEMAQSMRSVTEAAVHTSDLSRKVVLAAEGGRSRVRETIEGMEQIQHATRIAEEVIQGLGGRAKEIGAVLDVIDDVADETNLLALNAAIIAAQAGEHGRPFSVVADEIKELADRVISSTKEISGLIRSVQSGSERAVSAIAEGSRSVAAGVSRSLQAGDSLDEILSASRESGTHIHEIGSAVREQSAAANRVNEMMESVSSGVGAIQLAIAEQERGNDFVSQESVAMRDVALQMQSTTGEQARAGARIRESIDGVREITESVRTALSAQETSCRDLADFLESVVSQASAGTLTADRLRDVTAALSNQAESLRTGVNRFQL